MRLNEIFWRGIFSLPMIFISIDSAYAYLEPGSASMVLQLLAAGVVGGLVWIKMSWDRIKSFFLKFKK